MAKGSVSIFLSHKGDDEDAAREIKRELTRHTGRLKVEIFEDMAAGRPYEECIHEALRSADILLLLYTDVSDEWDWCLYEAGWFTPLRDEEKRPVICLYNPEGVPPKPLRKLQAVAADPKTIKTKLLHPLYKTKELVDVDPVLNKNLSPEDLLEIGERIAAAIQPKQLSSRYYLERITVEATARDILDQGRVPPDTKVCVEDGNLELLELDQLEFTWQRFAARAAETQGYGTYWVDELEAAIVKAADTRPPRVLTGTFRGCGTGKIYRPILYRVDRASDGPRKFFVAFHEEIKPETVGGPGQVGLAFNLLQLGSRFRWEAIEPFQRRFRRETPDTALACRQLLDSIEAIENESQRHGYFDVDSIRPLFPADGPFDLDALMGRWERIRGQLAQAAQGQLAEDAAEPTSTSETMLALLAELGEMNQSFMVFISEVYAGLLAREVPAVAASPAPEPVPA